MKIVGLVGVFVGLLALASGRPIEGDPDAYANYDILPDVNVTADATVATVAPMLPNSAAMAKVDPEESLDKVYKILQITLSVVIFLVIIAASVWAAKRGEPVDWENGWARRVVDVLQRARNGVAHLQERRAIRNLR